MTNALGLAQGTQKELDKQVKGLHALEGLGKKFHSFCGFPGSVPPPGAVFPEAEHIPASVLFNTIHDIDLETVLCFMANPGCSSLLKTQLACYMTDLRFRKLAVDGVAIIERGREHGLTPGKTVGMVKAQLLDALMNGEVDNTPEHQLQKAMEIFFEIQRQGPSTKKGKK